MSAPALRLRGVRKRYRVRHLDHDHVTLAQTVLHRMRHPFRQGSVDDFWALDGIDLDIARGETFGLFGHNGAGKSTLLKVLSRITPPTAGTIEVRGRIGSLLEVGTGFHPELTGRENIYLNGSILGMRSREIERHFDDIVEFSGISEFLDTPVKRYSSGMYVRLAFSVAAHLDSDILLLDEVLAVGDADFQRRCLGKMNDVAGDGRTVLLVSHNIANVLSLCRRAAVLERGRIAFVGTAPEAAAEYESRFGGEPVDEVDLTTKVHFGDAADRRDATLIGFRAAGSGLSLAEGEPLTLDIDVSVHRNTRLNFGVGLVGADQNAASVGFTNEIPLAEGLHRVRFTTPRLSLVPGDYRLSLSCGRGTQRSGSTHDCDGVADAGHVRVYETAEGALRWSRAWGWNRLANCDVAQLDAAPTGGVK
jgi:ABC-type polysaccharide/polyol phosphate transport system ATPase subunit